MNNKRDGAFDKRTLRKNMLHGIITQKEYQDYLNNLVDCSKNAEAIDLCSDKYFGKIVNKHEEANLNPQKEVDQAETISDAEPSTEVIQTDEEDTPEPEQDESQGDS